MLLLDRLRRRLGIEGYNDSTLLSDLLDDAQNMVLDIIGRDSLPKRLEGVVLELSVIKYNRMGAEGESSRGEGGISQSYLNDLPTDLQRQLNNYPRKVRVMGNATVKTED